MAKVSVIVPVYKAERYLPRCIDSILAQKFTDFELILVEDGSPDQSGKICDEYAKRDGRIRVIHKENGGVSSARNAALDIATGTYIVFVDSDDEVSDKYIDELIRWQDYDYVTAGFMWQDHQSNWHERKFEEIDTKVEDIRKYPSMYLGKYYFGSPWATLMKRELIEKNFLRFDTLIHSGEDTLFILKYLECAASVKIVPLCGYYYHYYATSLVNRPHEDYWKWKITIERAFLTLFNEAKNEEYDFLLNRQFDVLIQLVDRYNIESEKERVSSIYADPFFKECVAHKMNYGTVEEKLFIYAMRHKSYVHYKKYVKYLDVLRNVKHKFKKVFFGR